jgi:pilus assembly protein Flp/PilA
MNYWVNTAIAHLKARAARDDRGQTAVEYLGIIAVVVAIVLAVTGTSIGSAILDKIMAQINKIV